MVPKLICLLVLSAWSVGCKGGGGRSEDAQSALAQNDYESAHARYVSERSAHADHPDVAQRIANGLNEKYSPSLGASLAELEKLPVPGAEPEWGGAKATLATARDALDEYDRFELLREAEYRSAAATSLTAQVSAIEQAYAAKAADAFVGASLAGGVDFFKRYPVQVAPDSVFGAESGALESALRNRTLEEVDRFLRTIEDGLDHDARDRVGLLYASMWLAKTCGERKPSFLEAAALVVALSDRGVSARPAGIEFTVAMIQSPDAHNGAFEFPCRMEDDIVEDVIRRDSLNASDVTKTPYLFVVKPVGTRVVVERRGESSLPSTYRTATNTGQYQVNWTSVTVKKHIVVEYFILDRNSERFVRGRASFEEAATFDYYRNIKPTDPDRANLQAKSTPPHKISAWCKQAVGVSVRGVLAHALAHPDDAQRLGSVGDAILLIGRR